MDYFEQLRRIQKFMDDMNRPMKEFERMQRQLQAASVRFPVSDLIDQFEKNQAALAAMNFGARQQALWHSIQPLQIDFAGLEFVQERLDKAAAIFDRLNAGISDARLLGEVELPTEEPGESGGRQDVAQIAQEQLVDVMPAEALEDLARVEFAPLVLLDRALRDPQLMRQLESRQFEGFVARLLDQLGFENVVLTPRSGDNGRDVLATTRVFGISMVCAFECKKYASNRPVGPEVVRALLGTITHAGTRANKGILVTTSSFSPSARQFILTEPSLDGKDFDDLVGWLREYGTRSKRQG